MKQMQVDLNAYKSKLLKLGEKAAAVSGDTWKLMQKKSRKFIKGLTFFKASRAFLALFLLTFPFQIRKLVFYPEIFVTGNFNYYISFFVYLADLLLVCSFIFYGISFLRKERVKFKGFGYREFFAYLMVFLLLMVVSVFVSEVKEISLFQTFRFLELLLLYVLITNEVLKKKEVLRYFIFGMCFQAVIGIGQYILQGSVGLRAIGEPIIGSDVQGVAKMDLGGEKVLRSYGTFSHPNVFAGLLVAAIVFTFSAFRNKIGYILPVVALLCLGLLFTFSRTGILAIGTVFLMYVSLIDRKIPIKTVLLFASIIMFFVVTFNLEDVVWSRFILGGDTQAGIERIDYMNISKRMISDRPWGTGLGSFTLEMQDYTSDKLAPWTHQPVHNIYLLFINELGLVGGLFFTFLIGFLFLKLVQALKFLKDKAEDRDYCIMLLALLMGIIIMGLFDHYLITIYQGQVMLFIYLALAGSFLNSSSLPFRKS
ncbi:O-antigen ligase family protein [Pseudomonadota bacterium]